MSDDVTTDPAPTPGTKAALEAENARLRNENAALRASSGRPPVSLPGQPPPYLTEGERQELEIYGVTTSPFDGTVVTTESARARMAESDDQQGVEIADVDPEVARNAPKMPERTAIRGFDYVYPSIAPGVLDPDYLAGR